ncbi:BrnT family toxin [Hwanghaeella sp.]|uniref:BrnT family toxin n=1 Tax=Hwanghaeella sp. TaxID=2605943 RepID=UPI003CCC0437
MGEDGTGIEFDPAKEAANVAKHGVSLSLLGAVLAGEVITFPDERRDYGEARFVTFGLVKGRLYVAVWTPRSEGIRAISVRKANRREEDRYG